MIIRPQYHPLPLLSLSLLFGFVWMTGTTSCTDSVSATEEGGIASHYPGDRGIDTHPSVVFSEVFEEGDLEKIEQKWGHISNREGRVMEFTGDVPRPSSGTRSLKMTATDGENAGGELYKTFDPGWDKIHLRFYTKFAEDHGNYHHFVALRGLKNPDPYPSGGAGELAENYFSVTVEPATHNINRPSAEPFAPPGIWSFYTYWPEMRSWQTPEGTPDGRDNPYYGNNFQPEDPVLIPRGEWICVEMMLKLNSSPGEKDGELALWIDGEQVVRFAPGAPAGYWYADRFRNAPDHEEAAPFEGFRWRHDMDVKINILRLQHYVSDRAFNRSRAYAEDHPDYPVDTEQAVVWFDHVVMATEYIGPIAE